MNYFSSLLASLGSPPASPLGPKPTAYEELAARAKESARFTSLLEENSSFSFVRMGDMDLALLLAMQDNVADPFGLEERRGDVNGTLVCGHPGIGMQYAPRLLKAFCEADFVDFHQRLWPVGLLLPRLDLPRKSGGFENSSAETSYLLLTWVETEFASYCSRHSVGFAGAEASLLKWLLENGNFCELAREYWPVAANRHFHQVRRDGRNVNSDAELIKTDLKRFVEETGVDTLFLSLGGAAKFLCVELARECGIRAIDFGAMLRALTYSGSDGHSATRATHYPYFYRVPFATYMTALRKAFPGMSPEEYLAKAHSQVIRELQHSEVGWTTSGWEMSTSPCRELEFRDTLREYRRLCRPLFGFNAETRMERRRFLHFCGKHKLSAEGRWFYTWFRGKSLAKRLLAEQKTGGLM